VHDLILVAQVLLALVFAVAGISKLANPAGSRTAMTDFGVPHSIAPLAAILLPLAELAVAVALLTTYTWYGAAGALALLLIFMAGIGYNLARGRHPDCRCFGQLQSKPVGASTLIRNAALAALAGAVLWAGPDVTEPGLLGRLGDLTGGQVAILAAVLAVALAVSGLVWFLGSLLSQQGRILARLDALEARLNQLPAPSQGSGAAAAPPPAPVGLPIGAPAPAFRLADLAGRETGLAELLAPGRPLLLLFMDPHCGPCTALMPDVARWHREHGERMTLAIVSRGKLKENRAKYGNAGLEHVLLQENYEVGERYSAVGTPSAVAIRPDGRIGSFVLQGAEMIKSLLDQRHNGGPAANGAHGHGHAQPAADAMGKPAPGIRLPDLEGRMQELAPGGKETVVLFWNPGCGFCQRMRDDIKRWEASEAPGKPNLLVVSTGTVESNRAEGFSSPVLIDSGFATASKFGASGTPSAVLVDGRGHIASGVAVGSQAVLSLVAPLEVSVP
jgi:thiol-disulfide isomerase/thioredoxin/uncharacterized membrane protein YphA (DoxX/SURF4 family)